MGLGWDTALYVGAFGGEALAHIIFGAGCELAAHGGDDRNVQWGEHVLPVCRTFLTASPPPVRKTQKGNKYRTPTTTKPVTKHQYFYEVEAGSATTQR